jgi:MFS family permease
VDATRARNQRALIAVVQVAALSCWFSASAVAPGMQQELDLGATGAVLLTSSVQVGFVVGALSSAALNLADRVPTAFLYAMSAFLAAACTALIAAFATGLPETLVLRVFTGMALAGVYPVGMKLMASWSEPARRGRALGLLVGALTLGSAVPQLIRGLQDLPWPGVLLAAAGVTAAGGLTAVLLVRPGPHLQPGGIHLEPAYALRMFRERGPRLANLGYLGHMWELYALWTWLPTFVLLSQREAGGSTGAVVNLTSFLAIGVAGVLGCWLGGVASDRFGRAPAAVTAMVVSGTCCLLAPMFFGTPVLVLGCFLFVWGAAVIADSAVFSTALTETADQRFVGTALTAQTATGFLLTVVTIHVVPMLADAVGWQYVFLALAIGPLSGAVAMARFGRARSAGAILHARP